MLNVIYTVIILLLGFYTSKLVIAAARAAVSVAIFPAQRIKKVTSLNIDELSNDYPNFTFEPTFEKTSLNRTISTITIKSKLCADKANGTILIFNGQNATWQDRKKIGVYCKLAEDTGYTIIGFDYAGTGERKITTNYYKPLVDDGKTLAKQIICHNNRHHKLILKGNSLGGAIATLVAADCHRQGERVYLWNGRSFSRASEIPAGYLRTLFLSGFYENKFTVFISNMSKPLFRKSLKALDWEIDAASAYLAIPVAFKNFTFVRSTKQDRLSKKDDKIVPTVASLNSNHAIRLEVKRSINDNYLLINDPNSICFYQHRRKSSANTPGNAHGKPETELYCRHDDKNRSVYDVFCLFATKYVNAHHENMIVNDIASPSRKMT